MNYKRLLGAASAALMIVIVIFMLVPGAGAQSKYKTLHQFTTSGDGSLPYASLILDAAGSLYGTASHGGAYGYGVVFKLTSNQDGQWTESVLYSFAGGTDGTYPGAPLLFDSVGNLYGTTRYGGTGTCALSGPSGCGTVFELTPNRDGSWSETVLYSFTGVPDGFVPAFGGLTFGKSGNLYGTTHYGGKVSRNCTNGCGTVFQLEANLDGSWTESVLYRFDEPNGWNAFGPVVFDEGNIYGTTSNGGGSHGPNCPPYPGCGAVFELTQNPDGSWTEKILHRFRGQDNGDGGISYGGLTLAPSGILYGTTGWGAHPGTGGLFTETPQSNGSWKYHWSHSFQGGKDAAVPWGTLILDAAGNLYGTTLEGGSGPCQVRRPTRMIADNGRAYGNGCGTVFKLTPRKGAWSERVLHSFKNHPGAYPHAGVILDTSGNLYGTTTGDASTTFGTVFEITP